MALFAILCALLVEQVYPLPVRNPVYLAYQAAADWAVRSFDAGRTAHGWLSWAFAVVLPALGVALVYKILLLLAWPLGWVWAAVVLYFTLGFRQFSGHVTAIRDALEMGDEIRARQLLAEWKDVDTADLPRSDILRQVLDHAVLDAHSHVFGVIVAFLVCAVFGLGPAGAVLFRSAEFVLRHWRQQAQKSGGLQTELPRAVCAQTAWNIINWLPSRTTAAVFAAAGNFEQAVDNWRQQAILNQQDTGFANADAIVLAAAMGAVDLPWPLRSSGQGMSVQRAPAALPMPSGTAHDPTEWDGAPVPPDVPAPPFVVEAGGQVPVAHMQHLQQLVGLVWRSVILWGGMIALVTVTRWVVS